MISLSLAAHARGNVMISVITGTLAVFIRELALPFVLIMLFLAWKERRQGETLGWLAGVTAFSLALTYHASIVSGLLTPEDQINRSWVQFNGWPFVLSTGNWNVCFTDRTTVGCGYCLTVSVVGNDGSPRGWWNEEFINLNNLFSGFSRSREDQQCLLGDDVCAISLSWIPLCHPVAC